MKTNRKSIVLMAAILIACMCVCMATKEGLESNAACEWIVRSDEINTKTCKSCPTGDFLDSSPPYEIGKSNYIKYTCGEKS